MAVHDLIRNASGVFRQRFMFMAGGIITGLVAYAFAIMADYAAMGFNWVNGQNSYLGLMMSPFGLALSAYLAQRYFPGSSGSGIPQCIAAIHGKEGGVKATFLSLRIAFGKIMLTCLGLLCGASIGREGPTVQIGASIMTQVGRFFDREQRGMILAGSAAGIAAAFNAPLAGIVFAIEELSRSYESKTSGIILTTTILAGLTASELGGNYAYFGYVSGDIGGVYGWLGLIVVAIIGGLLGGIFSRVIVDASRSQFLRSMMRRSLVGFAFCCGVIISVCGYFSGGATYGTGYEVAFAQLHNEVTEPWVFVPLKMLATGISTLSGIPGGLFSPSLSIGAGIGGMVSEWFSLANASQLALLGMAAYLTGVVQSPVTAVVIMAEMTDNHRMVVPLLACAFLADWVSKLIQPHGIYHGLAQNFMEKDKP